VIPEAHLLKQSEQIPTGAVTPVSIDGDVAASRLLGAETCPDSLDTSLPSNGKNETPASQRDHSLLGIVTPGTSNTLGIGTPTYRSEENSMFQPTQANGISIH
jgi:hypothetical protein